VFVLTNLRERALSACSQAGMVNNLNDGLAWGLFPLLFARAGLGVGRIGVLAAAYPAVWGTGQLLTGSLSDRLGRKGLIVAGMAVQAAALALTAATRGFAPWLAGAMLLGAGTAMVYPTLLAAVGDVAHPRWRASAVGVYRLWRDSGFALGRCWPAWSPTWPAWPRPSGPLPASPACRGWWWPCACTRPIRGRGGRDRPRRTAAHPASGPEHALACDWPHPTQCELVQAAGAHRAAGSPSANPAAWPPDHSPASGLSAPTAAATRGLELSRKENLDAVASRPAGRPIYLDYNATTPVAPAALAAAISPRTVLVSIQHANSETGTIQPIPELAEVAHAHGVLLHSDAAQSVGKVPVAVDELGVDLLTVVGHKLYAPKGVGALYVRQGVALAPVIFGGASPGGLLHAGAHDTRALTSRSRTVISPASSGKVRYSHRTSRQITTLVRSCQLPAVTPAVGRRCGGSEWPARSCPAAGSGRGRPCRPWPGGRAGPGGRGVARRRTGQ
jgi:Aminotransferase class-V/Major Facilitator Superfamily